MSAKPSSHPSPDSAFDLPGGPDGLPRHAERSASSSQYPSASAVGGRSVGEVRDQMTRFALSDNRTAVAIHTLILAAHEVNKFDLSNEAINGICEAALRYAAELKRLLGERGMSHE